MRPNLAQIMAAEGRNKVIMCKMFAARDRAVDDEGERDAAGNGQEQGHGRAQNGADQK